MKVLCIDTYDMQQMTDNVEIWIVCFGTTLKIDNVLMVVSDSCILIDWQPRQAAESSAKFKCLYSRLEHRSHIEIIATNYL